MGNVNGNYDVCKAFSKFPIVESIEKSAANHHRHRPEFMYMHLAKGQKGRELEFGIYLQPLPEMGFKAKELIWVLAQINVGEKKTDPILLYYAPRVGHDNVPPPKGWKPLGGIEPLPLAELIELTLPKKIMPRSPLKKAIDAANEDISKMEELMFDLDKKSNAKLGAKTKTGPNVVKQVNMAPRHNIVQPGAKTKDM